MILSIHQPSYFPWLGLLDKIAKTNNFVLLDDVQVVKGTYQYRNTFFTNGKAKYLTLPINYSLGIKFNELEFINDSWIDQHLNILKNYYLKAPFFSEVYIDLQNFYLCISNYKPIDVLAESMQFCFSKLGIDNPIIRSSSLHYTGKSGKMVLDICRKMKANTYLAGSGSREYMQKVVNDFNVEGIQLNWHSFKHPVYTQHPNYNFIEGLSCLDLFFYQGYKNAKSIFWDNIN